jgi:hypothetical protein
VAARGCAHRILAASGKFDDIASNALRRPNSSPSTRSILPPNRVPNGIAEYRGEGRPEFTRETAILIFGPFSSCSAAKGRPQLGLGSLFRAILWRERVTVGLILAPFSHGTPWEKGWG